MKLSQCCESGSGWNWNFSINPDPELFVSHPNPEKKEKTTDKNSKMFPVLLFALFVNKIQWKIPFR